MTDITLRFVYGIGILVILMPAIQGWPAELFAEREITIAIVQPQNVEAYQEAVKGFLTTLKKNFSLPVNLIVYDSPEGLYKTLKAPPDSGEQVKIDLIVTIGTNATADVSRTIQHIPIVFSMVLDPDAMVQHRRDMVGASLNIPVEVQLKFIKEVLPAAKTVGVIYDPSRNTEYVQRLNAISASFHFRIIAFPVTSQKDIPQALNSVRAKSDVLLGIVDNTVYTSRTTEFIIRFTVQEQLPFIGLSLSYVKAGALCSLVFDNYDIGRQTAELVQKILSGVSPATLQITVPEKLNIALNLRTANIIGVPIPKQIQRKAAIVYE
ncbi:MAG: ABC transporter substrate-binding protein [Candidatus Vecturithrix sp.]|nr:ABC transporter substrate-binding protein [Candidatus Vecturithrix sp.]